mmetsp:Transcript_29858/g.41299  ORF Transcript_29858/g.41299 Transcript_29858/m.41299 type:complete len:253 (+) Transcript_29858:949-1707(+)
MNGIGATLCPIATNHVQLVDAPGLDRIHNLADVRSPAGGPKNGAPLVLDGVHIVRVQINHILGVESTVAISHTKDVSHSVDPPEGVHNFPDDGVEPGTQAPAGHHRSAHFLRGKVNHFAGTCSAEQSAGEGSIDVQNHILQHHIVRVNINLLQTNVSFVVLQFTHWVGISIQISYPIAQMRNLHNFSSTKRIAVTKHFMISFGFIFFNKRIVFISISFFSLLLRLRSVCSISPESLSFHTSSSFRVACYTMR